MGEFLLTILGINPETNDIIYTTLTPYAKYKIGQCVTRYYPHGAQNKPYYRIYDKAYDEQTLRTLLESQNPDVIDQNMFTRYQREMQDAEIYEQIAQGLEAKHVAREMGWVAPAVSMAAERHKKRIMVIRNALDETKRAKLQAMIDAFDDGDEELAASLVPREDSENWA